MKITLTQTEITGEYGCVADMIRIKYGRLYMGMNCQELRLTTGRYKLPPMFEEWVFDWNHGDIYPVQFTAIKHED